MADTYTAHYTLTKPQIGIYDAAWGTKWAANLDAIDTALWGKVNAAGGTLTNPVINGNLLLTSGTGGLGYGTGAGGTVTQPTDKSTGVTLNKPYGIVTMATTSMSSGTSFVFVLTNSCIASTDIVYPMLNASAYADEYSVKAYSVTTGACRIMVTRVSGAARTDAVPVHFIVFKGATT